jgi:predicted outer membrane protein
MSFEGFLPKAPSTKNSKKIKEDLMFHKISAIFIALTFAGTVLATDVQPLDYGFDHEQGQTQQVSKAKLSRVFSLLHAVHQACEKVSAMAQERAGNEEVKAFAQAMGTQHSRSDSRLLVIAKKFDIEIKELDPTTPEGKSVMDRIEAEAKLLGSLEGDAWDKAYLGLTRVAQTRVIRFLQKKQRVVAQPEVKAFIGDAVTAIRNNRNTARALDRKICEDSL